MAAGVVHIPVYATLFRADVLADGVADFLAPASLKYGASKYTVQRSRDDMNKITALIWFNSKDDWYRFWEGEEAIEFRARFMGKYQVPITYVWHDEIGSDAGAPKPAAVAESVSA
ncbi:MAG: hypothetical protein J2O48_11220 [Solirubrobacterales bacterium]|nr:hypothetical protein [Solirubrobacterales bacterium]